MGLQMLILIIMILFSVRCPLHLSVHLVPVQNPHTHLEVPYTDPIPPCSVRGEREADVYSLGNRRA